MGHSLGSNYHLINLGKLSLSVCSVFTVRERRKEERREGRREESRKGEDHSPLVLEVMVLIYHTQLYVSVLKAERNEHKCYKHQQRQTGNYVIIRAQNRKP